jgi:hypothetical protein
MLLKFARTSVILLTALSLGTVMAHFLEMPAKRQVEPGLWLAMLQQVYPAMFGTVGAAFEIGAMVGAVGLAFAVRRRRPAFGWTLAAAAILIASHAVFWALVAPVNAVLVPLTPDALPADWTQLRDQWEFTHSARAVLQFLALGALVVSVVAETPKSAPVAERSGTAPAGRGSAAPSRRGMA